MTCPNGSTNASTRELFVIHMPSMIFLLLVLMFGIIGNIVVLYIYCRKIRVVIFGFFVKVLAIFDIATTNVAVPAMLMFRLASPEHFDAKRMCQMTIFMKHFSALNSGIMFIIIAFQRYRKVCQPQETQMSELLAKRLCLTSVCVSAAASTPIIFVVSTTMICIERESDFVPVPICDFNSHTKLRPDSIIYATWVSVELVGITATLTALYGSIARTLRAHNRAVSLRPIENTFRDKTRTATITFFVLTVVFLLSSAPLVFRTIYSSLVKIGIYWSRAEFAGVDLAVNLTFLNCAVNPFVYSFTSSAFRKECKRVLCISDSRRPAVTVQASSLQSQLNITTMDSFNTT